MDEVTIKIRENGPLLVTGPITLIDHDGETFETSGNCVLCRCGASTRKPFCDGSHKTSGPDSQPFDGATNGESQD